MSLPTFRTWRDQLVGVVGNPWRVMSWLRRLEIWAEGRDW